MATAALSERYPTQEFVTPASKNSKHSTEDPISSTIFSMSDKKTIEATVKANREVSKI